MTDIFVSDIVTYPIKSIKGVHLSNSWIDDYGLSFDRRFVVSDLLGKFITARSDSKLCLIQANITPTGLILIAPDMPKLELNYQSFSQRYQTVTVWSSEIAAQHCGQQIDKWFSQYLNKPCQLLYFGSDSSRLVKNSTKQVAFADGYPLLLASQSSLADLSDKAGQTFSMAQFRPNIEISGAEAFAEDQWLHIRIGEVEFEVVKPCTRCNFTTIDPKTGEASSDNEPLATLMKYRRDEEGEVLFGQNMIPLNQGQINVGDSVEIIRTKATRPTLVPQKKSNEKTTEIEKIAPPSNETSVNILFDSWDTYHKGNNQETILEQGEAAGLILPYSCRGGICGRCKIKVADGQVLQLKDDALTDQEKGEGYVLACSSIPLGNITLVQG
ncbi:YcbX family protein [Thalassotalea agarivorans]|uniref:MOSC domain-containing protein n=1 Tax=Thalassotalea agarivorans TaxID=349064 RepID=A0A1I0GL23_THASX|nr:MOSC N-terminal beta barrel domain-containing protein [Thalassotalea agarivorans]SET71653.1 hypothetical protein SAMN05660429_02486 [Thalassotalea agarivorans]